MPGSEGTIVTDSATIERARQAVEDHAWQEAFEGYEEAAGGGGLTGLDLERFAEAGWWTAHPHESLDAMEAAFTTYVSEGNPQRAAFVALHVADAYSDRLQSGLSNGWRQRAVRLLADLPESVEHGYLELALLRSGEGVGSSEDAMGRASSVLDIATRFGDRDLQAFGLLMQGRVLIAQAKVEEGLALIDEATVAAVGGDLTPITTGIVYCVTIDVCRDLADFGRAGEWTEAATRWCQRQSVPGFPGICRVHRAEIMRLRGAFADAEGEARRSTEELMEFGLLPAAGGGFHQIGEVRLRIGDLDAAEEAFGQAHQLGHDPQPGMAMLLLARKRTDAARASITAALADEAMPLTRARLLPARVEIALAAHDVADAREAAEELASIASRYDAPAMHANAHQALGAVLTHEEDVQGAITELRRAVRHWTDADLPFETAQARRWLAIAYREDGDGSSATLELRAARSTFDRLGARLETERCDEMLRAWEAGGAGRRVARTFLFTDVVGSTNLLETMGDGAWEDVMRWHNDTLRALVESHGGEVVHSTGDGFFTTFPDATSASTCAVAIQRRLAEHRREHGFAPPVRIGLHAGEASAVADDYAGIGVHEAARVGALAEGGEIVITCETLEAEPIPFPVANERTVSLKGLAQPVRVVSIEWRGAGV